eukprot:707217-Prymnesium_polylepis.1
MCVTACSCDVTWGHMGSHGVTWGHMGSGAHGVGVTWGRMGSHGVTWPLRNSMWLHACSCDATRPQSRRRDDLFCRFPPDDLFCRFPPPDSSSPDSSSPSSGRSERALSRTRRLFGKAVGCAFRRAAGWACRKVLGLAFRKALGLRFAEAVGAFGKTLWVECATHKSALAALFVRRAAFGADRDGLVAEQPREVIKVVDRAVLVERAARRQVCRTSQACGA